MRGFQADWQENTCRNSWCPNYGSDAEDECPLCDDLRSEAGSLTEPESEEDNDADEKRE
jgi:hypothetical protein